MIHSMAPKILLVDDEPPIIELLAYNLKRLNYTVVTARDGLAAVELARRERPDLVILDLMLPGLDGLEVCRILRKEGDIPIIMLTARDSEVDRVVGLELGADDYVVKPFSVRELVARVKNVLRRTAPRPAAPEGDHPLQVAGLLVDPARREACWRGQPLELTTLEFDLLYTLAQHPNQVLSRSRLLELVWGYDYFGDLRAVDAAVKRLRSRLHQATPPAEIIAAVRGVGYKLAVPED